MMTSQIHPFKQIARVTNGGHSHNGGAPMSHGNDHWLALGSAEIPVAVRMALQAGSGWRTFHAEGRWWGCDGSNYYGWLRGGPAPGLSKPAGLGATDTPAGVPSNCCQTNSGLYWIAGAIAALAVAVTANVVKGGKKKGKKKTAHGR
jgi:hypothetical protein